MDILGGRLLFTIVSSFSTLPGDPWFSDWLMEQGVTRIGTRRIVISPFKVVSSTDNLLGIWWGGEEWYNGDDGRGGVEGERSSSSFRLMRVGCEHLINDQEEEVVGENWEVNGGEEMLLFMLMVIIGYMIISKISYIVIHHPK